MKKTLVCLSSGMTPQYRLDILRLMALPGGTEIQFRYDEGIVDETLRENLTKNAMRKASALLCYLDCTAENPQEGQVCPVVPCRHAKLIDSTKVGRFFILRFCLGEFADCADIAKLETKLPSSKPHWKKKDAVAEVKPSGLWCFNADLSHECAKSSAPEVWQATMTRLWRSKDFRAEEFFFNIEGIFERGERTSLTADDGEFKLSAAKEYEAKVFHFHPDSDAHQVPTGTTILRVTPGSSDLTSITTPTLPIDSPYDLKSFHLRSGSPASTQYSSLTIRFENESDAKAVPTQPQLFIPIKIVPSRIRLFLSTVVIAALLFLQQWISATAKGPIDHATTFVLGVLAVLTAALAVYSLKKPL